MISRQQWHSMTPKQQWGYLQLIEQALESYLDERGDTLNLRGVAWMGFSANVMTRAPGDAQLIPGSE